MSPVGSVPFTELGGGVSLVGPEPFGNRRAR
jgi:hypothetical protein